LSPLLSAVILTLNEEKHIEDCIDSLRWADQIIVFDSFSQDKTVPLAEAAGATVFQSRFENYAQQRNAALTQIQTDWVFFVDADERGTPALAEEIHSVTTSRPEAGWYVPRHNYIFGRLTKGAGWFPDYQLRLLNKAKSPTKDPSTKMQL
jgi:glycosyltransferase involved in cell wall biosynthesis